MCMLQVESVQGNPERYCPEAYAMQADSGMVCIHMTCTRTLLPSNGRKVNAAVGHVQVQIQQD